MSNPLLPPYLGSWNDLLNALLHDPGLGTGHSRPHKTHADSAIFESNPMPGQPEPVPWSIAGRLLSTLVIRSVAAKIGDAALREQMLASTSASIAADIDDLCPPIPWPGPPWWHWQVVVGFGVVANTLQEGELRNEVTRVAAQLLERGLSNAKTQTR